MNPSPTLSPSSSSTSSPILGSLQQPQQQNATFKPQPSLDASPIPFQSPILSQYLSYRNIGNSIAKMICRLLPGSILWINAFILVLLAVVDPRSFFIATTPFAFLNLYIVGHTAFFSYKGFNRIRKNANKDFYHEYHERRKQLLSTIQQLNAYGSNSGGGSSSSTDGSSTAAASGEDRTSSAAGGNNGADNYVHLIQWENVRHYVIIPNYRSPVKKLQETLLSLSQSRISKHQIIIVLAMEEREQGAEQKAKALQQQFRTSFLDIFYTLHPSGIPHEQQGKSTNEAWASKIAFEDVKRRNFDTDNVCITICDSDSIFHPKHFECLTHKFCNDPNRYYRIWCGPIVSFRNFFTVPAPTRMLSMMVSLHEMAALSDSKDHHIPFGAYSMSMFLAQMSGGWDKNIITEDWHMYIKCFFASAGRARVSPIHLPVQRYAVENPAGYWPSIYDRFTQAKRHAWGVYEISYFLYKSYEAYFELPKIRRPHILRTLSLGWKASTLHYLGGLSFFYLIVSFLLIGAYTWIPSLAASPIASSVTGNWSALFRLLNALTGIPVTFAIYTNLQLVRWCFGEGSSHINVHQAHNYSQRLRIYRIIQWIIEWMVLLPVVNLVFGAYPTWKAATRLMFTEQFESSTVIQDDYSDEPPEQQSSSSTSIQIFSRDEDTSSTRGGYQPLSTHEEEDGYIH